MNNGVKEFPLIVKRLQDDFLIKYHEGFENFKNYNLIISYILGKYEVLELCDFTFIISILP